MLYTTILHEPRLRFGLSCNEYCIADSIYHLSNNPKNDSRWCYKSRVKIGESMGLSKQSVLKIIERLVSCGLVEMHAETKYLRTTEVWYKNFTTGKESSPPDTGVSGKESSPRGKESSPISGKESSPQVVKKVYPIYIDIMKDNNNIINKEKSEFSKNENYALLSENEFIKSESEKKDLEIQALKDQLEKKIKEKSSAKKESLVYDFPEDFSQELINLFMSFVELRNATKAKAVKTQLQVNLLIKKLIPFSDEVRKVSIENAISGNWTSFFPKIEERSATVYHNQDKTNQSSSTPNQPDKYQIANQNMKDKLRASMTP